MKSHMTNKCSGFSEWNHFQHTVFMKGRTDEKLPYCLGITAHLKGKEHELY